MAIPSKEYWAERARLREEESYKACGILTDKLMQEYDVAARNIRREIADFYAKYATKYGLSYEEAIKTLSQSEMREWKATLKEYVEHIAAEKDPDVKKKLTAQLDALSTNSRITRLEALEGQIDMILNELFDKGVAQMKAEFGDMFIEGYYKKSFDIQSRQGFFNELAKISTDEVEHILTYPWSGMMFSDRLWQNKQALVYNVREILTQGIIQGKSVDAMTQALSAKMGQSYKVAERLIRTETNYIHSESCKAAYNAAGIEQYEFMATLSERTCEKCGEMDGKVFNLKDAVVGINFNPLHPNCRCTTVDYDPYDIQDRIAAGEPIPEDMTYSEWKKKQDLSSTTLLTNSKKQSNINYAKATDLFIEEDLQNPTEITPEAIFDELKTSSVGRETIEYIISSGVRPQLVYSPRYSGERGSQRGRDIKIFLRNIQSTRVAAQTVIHEITHQRYGIGGCQWAEAVCMAQEKKHIVKRDNLTISELKQIVKLAKTHYPEYNWKKGGYINGQRF